MDHNNSKNIEFRVPIFDTPALSSTGVEFDPNEDFWKLDRTAVLNFQKLAEVCTSRFFVQVKTVAKILAETKNAYSASISFMQFRMLSQTVSEAQSAIIDVIDSESLTTWLLRGNNRNYVAQLRIFTRVAKTFEANLLTESAQHFLDNMNLSSHYNELEAVRNWDPNRGAFRPAEDLLIATKINEAFTEGKMSLREYFVMRMIRGFALRPSMLTSMKTCDIRDGGDVMHVRIPMAKQRGVQMRGQFMPWKPVSAGLADVIRIYLAEEVFPFVAPSFRENAPLFWNREMKRDQMVEFDGSIAGHATLDNITSIFQKTMRRLNLVSPLTGEKIHNNPRRERHTYATHLAMNGADAAEIAINLGQSSASSCEPYIDATVSHFQSIENSVGTHYIAVGDRFIGNVMSQDKDPNEFRIVNSKSDNVGTCSASGCGAIDAGVAPFACYICRKFNAWEDGPHQEILDELLKEQVSRRKSNHADFAETTTDTIIAITDLIERINQRQEVPNAQ